MSNNSRKINYRLRISKAVERKMFCSAFQKLSVFYPLENYRYIGFGALYFADFYLLHRQLGIKNMLSIEKSRSAEIEARYNFNKPFRCVKVMFGSSHDVLPQLSWDEPTIAWLDYTCSLNSDVLSDVNTFIQNAVSGSFLIVSVNSDSSVFDPDENDEIGKSRLNKLSEMVGKYRIPREIENNQISNAGLPRVYQKILNYEIESIIQRRNAGSTTDQMHFQQLFNFKYQDGKPMYTFGGLILSDLHLDSAAKVKFDELDFISRDEGVFEIQIPNLTYKEIKYLEGLLPGGISDEGVIEGLDNLYKDNPQIPEGDLKKFAKIYQYFPTFAETQLG